MPGATVTLFAQVTDPVTGDVNVNDALQVTFQYFDGVDWMWCNGGAANTSANAIDAGPGDGWSIDWTVPDPSTDLKDNDGDGFVDEADEGQFTVQVRAVVRDLAFNLAYGSPATDFTDERECGQFAYDARGDDLAGSGDYKAGRSPEGRRHRLHRRCRDGEHGWARCVWLHLVRQ
jgi:hypothetical protein